MSTIKTTNITHSTNSGTSNIVLDSSGNATVNGNLTVTGTAPGLFSSYALLAHVITANYKVPSENEETRPLNTELDPDNIVTLDTGTGIFTLGVGTYMIKWGEQFYDTYSSVSMFRKWNGAAFVDSEYPDSFDIVTQSLHATSQDANWIFGTTRVTVSSGTQGFALRHHVHDNANAGSGGYGAWNHISEITSHQVARVEIFKEL